MLKNLGFKKTMLALLSVQAFWLTACQTESDPLKTPRVDQYLSEQPYRLAKLEHAKSITVMTYSMQNVQGKLAQATALVYFPKTPKPKDGWRVVVWAHGTVGVGDSCAPSQQPLKENFSDLAEKLLAEGYVILAPDYEGLGTPGIHPYLNLRSEAKSMLSAVAAFKQHYGKQLNGAWMSVGQSQGGQASLGTAEYANKDPSYKGAVAAAPASSLGNIILDIAPQQLAQLEQLEIAKNVALEQRNSIKSQATLLAYAALTGIGIKAYVPNFDYQDLFESRAAAFAPLGEGSTGENGYCLQSDNPEQSLVQIYQRDIITFLKDNPSKRLQDYPGINAQAFRDNQGVQKFLENSQPGTVRIDKPVLVIQGMQDTNVPYVVTEKMVNHLKDLGSDQLELLLVEKGAHTTAIKIKQPELLNFVQSHMPAK